MGMQTDVKAKSFTGTGQLGVGPCRIKGIYFTTTVAGTVAFSDAASSNSWTLTVPAGTNYLLLPGEGIWYRADPLVTVTSAVGTFIVFYG